MKKNGPSANEGERARAASVVPPQFPARKMRAGPLVSCIGPSRAALLGSRLNAGRRLFCGGLSRDIQRRVLGGLSALGPPSLCSAGPPTLLDRRLSAIARDYPM